MAQGNTSGVRYTGTIDFAHKHKVLRDRDVTYATFVLDHTPLKPEEYRVMITVDGNSLSYEEDSGSPAANLLEIKVLINSVISDAKSGAQFMTADIKNYFLANPMDRTEYTKVLYKNLPEDIKQKYNLHTKVTSSNYIYIRIKKGMCGLKQAAILVYDNLKQRLKPFRYTPITGTVGVWHRTTRPTKFCLYVDDFRIKYYSKDYAQHLLNAIESNY